MNALSATKQSESGQSLVEFAFSILLLLILLAGIVDIGRAFFSYMALHDAAQEGALYGSLYPEDINGIKQRVRQTSAHPVDLQDTANVQVPDPIYHTDPCEGHGIEVSVTYDFNISVPFLGVLVGSQQFPLTATVTDTILRPECP